MNSQCRLADPRLPGDHRDHGRRSLARLPGQRAEPRQFLCPPHETPHLAKELPRNRRRPARPVHVRVNPSPGFTGRRRGLALERQPTARRAVNSILAVSLSSRASASRCSVSR